MKHIKLAEQLQSLVRDHELNDAKEYSPAQVRQAVVHGREDISAIFSLLSSANSQLASIRLLLLLIAILLALLVLK